MQLTTSKKLMIGAFAAVFTLSACANPDDAEAESSTDTASGQEPATQRDLEAVPEIADKVPSDIRERGSLNIAVSSTNMPAQFTDDDGNPAGVVVELYDATAQILDLEPDFDVVAFDAFQPGLESERYDVATMGLSPEREEKFDIIALYNNGYATMAHSSFELDEMDFRTDLCGHSVAVTKGTATERLVSGEINDACVDAGNDSIEVSPYVDNAGVALAVQSRQNELGVLEIVVAMAYETRNPDQLKILGQDASTKSGATLLNTELSEPFREALLHLVETGVYEEVLTDHGISDMALPELPVF